VAENIVKVELYNVSLKKRGKYFQLELSLRRRIKRQIFI